MFYGIVRTSIRKDLKREKIMVALARLWRNPESGFVCKCPCGADAYVYSCSADPLAGTVSDSVYCPACGRFSAVTQLGQWILTALWILTMAWASQILSGTVSSCHSFVGFMSNGSNGALGSLAALQALLLNLSKSIRKYGLVSPWTCHIRYRPCPLPLLGKRYRQTQ